MPEKAAAVVSDPTVRPPQGDSSPTASSAAPATDADRLDRILVEEGLLTEEQLERARRIQKRLEEAKPLAMVAVDLGWISRARLDAALRQRQKKLSIVEILVEKGLLSIEKLREAEAAAKEHGEGGGASPIRRLVETGALAERDYLMTYSDRYDLPFVEADISLVDPVLLKKVSLKYLMRHRVLPLSIVEGRLTVLTDDMDKKQVFSELERLYAVPISHALTIRSQIDEILKMLASGGGEIRTGENDGAIQYHHIEENIDSGRITDIVDHIILKAIRQGASDIHIEPMQSKIRVRLRIDGSLVHITDYPHSYAAQIISRIKVLAQADVAEHRAHQDGKIHVRHGEEEVDLRASIYVTVFGENAVLRVLRKDRSLLGLEEMGFSPVMLRTFVEDVLEPSTGIVLVTGPTGSGKTTTLYAAVDRINDISKKIITCEDPVEYVLEGITQCSIANRPGINFVDSLKAIVRQDPDVILIGEIRDRESAEMAIQSALTGHKVLSTFHTEDSVGALVRLMDMNIETFMIASTVTAVLAQRLIRRQCPHCRVEHAPTARELRALTLSREDLTPFSLTRGRGCPQCFNTGFKGRIGVHELLVLNDAIRDAILLKKPSHELRRLAAETPSFVFLQEDAIGKALRGGTTLGEVLENTPRCQFARPLGRILEMYG